MFFQTVKVNQRLMQDFETRRKAIQAKKSLAPQQGNGVSSRVFVSQDQRHPDTTVTSTVDMEVPQDSSLAGVPPQRSGGINLPVLRDGLKMDPSCNGLPAQGTGTVPQVFPPLLLLSKYGGLQYQAAHQHYTQKTRGRTRFPSKTERSAAAKQQMRWGELLSLMVQDYLDAFLLRDMCTSTTFLAALGWPVIRVKGNASQMLQVTTR
ncbi:hypothetical protein DHEL01_v201480 [Diaporthe helianthi]|uniref:Uncharacterized protein n=1 Tax=Diaporthe helianthi TaxID=158607 RepID=A0A2P5ICA4_DIAHE|nr:hypothetical protein DHEL01_v201480 [Diaporthe helianthi]